MRKRIIKTTVDALKPGEIVADIEVRGFVVRKLPTGVVTYGLRYRDKISGKQRWLALGLHGNVTAEQARVQAKVAAGAVAAGRDPVAEEQKARADAERAAGETVNAALDAFLHHHARRLKSAERIKRAFDAHVRPRLGTRSIYSLRRSDITAVLDATDENSGPVMADKLLSHLRKAFNWQAARDDEFKTPLVPGMARTKPKERARKRTLTDEEIRDVWAGLDRMKGRFPTIMRLLLLTDQRRGEVARMEWPEVNGEIWVIPATRRGKDKLDHAVPLTATTRKLLGEPNKSGFVLPVGRKPLSDFSRPKAKLDALIAELRKKDGRPPMPAWTIHDLRRTARSLMSRAGVPADIAERVIGHAIPGVRAVYDRHAYLEEKRDALEKLDALLSRILNPDANVVVLDRAAKTKTKGT
jgi:integrase